MEMNEHEEEEEDEDFDVTLVCHFHQKNKFGFSNKLTAFNLTNPNSYFPILQALWAIQPILEFRHSSKMPKLNLAGLCLKMVPRPEDLVPRPVDGPHSPYMKILFP